MHYLDDKSTTTALPAIFFVSLVMCPGSAQAQERQKNQTCRGPIYGAREVTRRARIGGELDLNLTEQARVHNIHGRIVLQAVLCRSGQITDVQVIEGLPYGMTENAIERVRRLRFTPAEMNCHTVSQRMRFEFDINEGGWQPINPAEALGRTVETVEIMGNRRLTDKQVFGWIRTRRESHSITRNFSRI